MDKRLLITRSRHDPANQYLYAYSDEIIEDAQKLGWKVETAEDEKNNEQEVASRLAKNKPNFVFFNGHGTDQSVHGYKDMKIIDVQSASKLSGSIVFARSCSALNSLGKEAVKRGCPAFIGHRGLFLIPRVFEYECQPGLNPTAKPVLDVSNIVGKHILKGDTAQVAVNASQAKAGNLMLKMLSTTEPHNAAVFLALYQNSSTLGFEGDPNARA